ncbi:MAG: 4-hydroxy-tetrahydrodipicolinate reductase [Anaerovoracaceae bacterium]|jgi:4-hydroxy-tetrahydrodipicolinate reductase|nr:4-hydroxy-tetrahydrodipicolinate reductase [Anaerovoracaceae bacterium]
MAIRVIVSGAAGHMGRIVCDNVNNDPELKLAGCVDPHGEGMSARVADISENADVVIDFSSHEGTKQLLEDCIEKGLPIVLCTTGQTEDELAQIEEAAKKTAIFRSANMSVGVALVAKLVNEVAEKFSGSEIEIIEAHHNRKVDAPSGTAIMLADAAKKARPDSVYVQGRAGHAKRENREIGINSIRMGNIVGMHEVMFGTNTQTITIKHEAHDRALFADGAIDAAKFLAGKEAGMYNMNDLLGE